MQTNVSDFNNFTIRFGVPVIGSVLAAWATVWLLQTVNPLAGFCLLATLVMVVVAIVAPRVGLFLLLGLCAYSDLIKRLLVIFGDLSFDQVSYVLMAAPAVVVGLLLSLVTQSAFHQVSIRRPDFVLIGVTAILAGGSFALALKAGGGPLDAAKSAVNIGVFAGAGVVGMRAFRDVEDVEKFLRTLLLIFIPVPLYAFWQLYFGFANFEIDYLRSGLSIEIKQLFDIRPRPFSTLNSAGVLGTLCAGFFVLALYPRLARGWRALRPGEAVGSLAVGFLYFAGAVGSLVRSSHLVWGISLVCLWCFRTRRGTQFFYLAAVSGLIFVILGASWLEELLPSIDPGQFAQTDYGLSILSIGTYNDRLNGFINLTHSTDMYSWFGIPESQQGVGTTYSHDPISTLIMKVGVVGFTLLASGLAAGLFWVHRRLLLLPPGRHRLLAVLLASVLVGWLGTEILVNAVVTVFPLNALFWLFIGAIGFLVNTSAAASTAANDASDAGQRPTWQSLPASRGGT